MGIIPLDWDSDFFGLRIAKTVVSSEEDVVALSQQERDLRNHFDLIYIISEPVIDIPFGNVRLVDRKAIFSSNHLREYEDCPAIVQWESPDVTDSLVSLALVSGEYSRFKTDPRLPVGSYERLYTRWIEQSVNGAMATEVFCYIIDGNPRGLLTLDKRNEPSTIGLVAVDGECQHQGIGTALVRHAISYVHKHEGERISVATQLDNQPACHLYSKCGLSLESLKKIWHWWL